MDDHAWTFSDDVVRYWGAEYRRLRAELDVLNEGIGEHTKSQDWLAGRACLEVARTILEGIYDDVVTESLRPSGDSEAPTDGAA